VYYGSSTGGGTHGEQNKYIKWSSNGDSGVDVDITMSMNQTEMSNVGLGGMSSTSGLAIYI
jgi:hypothetical protein